MSYLEGMKNKIRCHSLDWRNPTEICEEIQFIIDHLSSDHLSSEADEGGENMKIFVYFYIKK
jgi:hypothetical protein